MFKIFLSLLFVSSNVMAGLPPTTVKGQSESSPTTTFNIQAPYYNATTTAPGTRLIESGNNNLLQNASFEHQTYSTGWTFTTGTPSAETTNVIDGKKSAAITISSQTGDIVSQSITPSPQLSTQNLEHSIWVKTTVTTIQVCALNSGTVVGTCQPVTGDGVWHQYVINAIGPASGTIGINVTTSASTTGTVYIDQGYVGLARNIGTVAQAQLIGQIKVSGCSAAWNTNSTSLAAFSAQTSCSYTVLQGSGVVSAPSTNIPGIKFSSLPPGNYTLKYEGTVLAHWASASGSANFQFWDGTNTANEISWIGDANASGYYSGASGIQQTISYSSPQSNITLSVRGKASAAGVDAQIFGTTSNPGVISVYWFPTQSQQVVTQQNAANVLGTVFYTAASICPANSLLADGSAVSRSAYASLFQNIGTTFGTGDGSTTFNLPDMRGIFVRGSGSQTISSISYSGTLGTKQGDQMQGHYHNPADIGISTALIGQSGTNRYVPSGGSTTGAPVSDGTNGTPRTGSETRPANIAMTPCIWYASQPAPLLTGSVTSDSDGSEKINRARIGGAASDTTNCTTSPCTIHRQSGTWLTSVTRTTTGTYVGTIVSGKYSDKPECWCQSKDSAGNAGRECRAIASSTTNIDIFTMYPSDTGGSTTTTDNFFSLWCMGAK